VTRNARGIGQVVVVIDVTVAALSWRNSMRSCQREPGGAVIESRRRPAARIVALRTSLRKIRCHVVRIRGALEIFQVA
jgi:hypothetical protein